MGHLMRNELTREGLLAKLANHYTTQGVLWLCMVVTISLDGFVADQMRFNLKSAQYLW